MNTAIKVSLYKTSWMVSLLALLGLPPFPKVPQQCCLPSPAGTTLNAAVMAYPGWDGHFTTPPAFLAVDVQDASQPIPSGIYPAWCIDASHFLPTSYDIPGTPYAGTLISTCDPQGLANLPAHGGIPPVGPPPTVSLDTWHEINYILNHKTGYYWWNVQVAIYRLVGGPAPNDPALSNPNPAYPPVNINEVNAILADASANAANWTLPCGGTVGVIFVMPDPANQPAPPAEPLYQLIMLEVPCVCLTCPSSCGHVGAPYSSALVAAAKTPPYTYWIISGSLPTGLTLNAAGTITGIPRAAGTFPFTAQVVDSSKPPQSKTVSCSITIYSALALTCAANTAQVGVPYSSALVASGGSGSYTYMIVSGRLPASLTINPTTGAITGTPTTAGTFTFTVAITDNAGCGTASQTCSITICGSSICGTVYADCDGNGDLSGGDVGYKDVVVTLKDAQGHVVTTVKTDANGKYCFYNLPAGNYTVAIVQPSSCKQTAGTTSRHWKDN